MIKRNPRSVKRNIEIWKSLKDYPGYQISNMGRVKSLDRLINHSSGGMRVWNGRILKNDLSTSGYLQIKTGAKTGANQLIHLLVIKHFGKPKPTPKHECNHKDLDKFNNWWNNLEWVTHSENVKHWHTSRKEI